MTPIQKKEFEALPTVAARAQWLLKHGVTATISIDPKTLSLVARPMACDTLLPGNYASEEEAITAGRTFLEAKAAGA